MLRHRLIPQARRHCNTLYISITARRRRRCAVYARLGMAFIRSRLMPDDASFSAPAPPSFYISEVHIRIEALASSAYGYY